MFRNTIATLLLMIVSVFGQATDSSIEVISQKSGGTYAVGSQLTVQWIMHDNAAPSGGVAVLITPDDGITWLIIVPEGIKSGDTAYYQDSIGTFSWTIPDSIRIAGRIYAQMVSNQCKVMVGAPYDGDTYVPSYSSTFTIEPRTGIRQSPNRAKPHSAMTANGVQSTELYRIDGRRIAGHVGPTFESGFNQAAGFALSPRGGRLVRTK